MRKSADVDIDVKPTCAPQFTRVADQLGIPTRYTRGCLAGLTYCVIGSEGIVRPCAYMTEDAGDVRKQPFDEIWGNGPVFERLRTQALRRQLRRVRPQEALRRLQGSRSGYYHNGDYMAQDDYCAYGQEARLHGRLTSDGKARCSAATRDRRAINRRKPAAPQSPAAPTRQGESHEENRNKTCAWMCTGPGDKRKRDGRMLWQQLRQRRRAAGRDKPGGRLHLHGRSGQPGNCELPRARRRGHGQLANIWELAGGTLVGASSDAFSDYHIESKAGKGRRFLFSQRGVHHRPRP